MVAVRVLLAALCALLVASAAAAVKVPHLTRKTFDSTVNDGRTHFIKCVWGVEGGAGGWEGGARLGKAGRE